MALHCGDVHGLYDAAVEGDVESGSAVRGAVTTTTTARGGDPGAYSTAARTVYAGASAPPPPVLSTLVYLQAPRDGVLTSTRIRPR
jgi:hypothetical protein